MGAPPPQGQPHTAPVSGSPSAPLSQWLTLMLAEIARKHEESERAQAEQAQRSSEQGR